MRIHTIEKLYSLDEIFLLIKNIIKPKFEIDENSYADESNLLIIGINVKDQSVIIRGSIDESKSRYYFSILALHSNGILKDFKSSNKTIEITRELGKILFNLVKNSKKNGENYAFSNLAIKEPMEREFQDQLVETETEILIKLLYSLQKSYNYSNILRKYPFSLIDIDGSWESWQSIYSSYIDLIENKLISHKSNSLSIKTFRNYDFALGKAYYQRIADLIISEEEEKQNSESNLRNSKSNFHNKNIDDEEENKLYNLKITFVFAHKKKEQLKLMQIIKLSDEVKKFAQFLHKNVFKQYNRISPQIVFISLYGYEESVGNYLRDNLHGVLSGTISILIAPPIDNNLWHNYLLVNDTSETQQGINLRTYNNLRRNGSGNQIQINKMDTLFKDLKETKKILEHNSNHLNDWANILSIDSCSKLLGVENSIS